ncbi:MAG TPA: hypothetical protein VGS23_04265, partial [Thermoplasmata archaeon]|nr:hypothetical protein [Thermoplasmata archaeon]
EARGAFTQKEYARVLEISIDAIDRIAQTRELYRRSREALEAATEAVGEATAVGAEPTEVSETLRRAQDLAGSGDYLAAAARAREAIDLAGWTIERRYAGNIAEVRNLLLTARSEGLEAAESVTASLSQAETFLKEKQWNRAREALERGQSEAFRALDESLTARLSRIESRRAELGSPTPEEAARRAEWAGGLETARANHAYAEAIAAVQAEEARGVESRRATLERTVNELKDRLWVGERLGLDTTPAMERFSEARMALDQGRLEAVEGEVRQGNAALEGLIREGISARSKQVETELLFARDGLRVRLGDLEARLAAVSTIVEDGRLVEAGRSLLAVEEEVTNRKAAHRQLMNLHYLIEAGLRRAAASRLDSGEARRLFEESQRDTASDYTAAIAKARASLKLVEGLLKSSEPPTAFWPFKRPAGDAPPRGAQ